MRPSFYVMPFQKAGDSMNSKQRLLAARKRAFASSVTKTKLGSLLARMFCILAVGVGRSLNPAAAAEDHTRLAEASRPIRWSQIGATAGAGYQGDGLAVIPTAAGARLCCAFQRLEGDATHEGLWLSST